MELFEALEGTILTPGVCSGHDPQRRAAPPGQCAHRLAALAERQARERDEAA